MADSDKGGWLQRIGDVASTPRSRVQGETCDGCGTTEGSMVRDTEDDWTLCRDCMNDPDTLDEAING